ncbi:MAG: hypothetical protein K9J74_08200 [Sulfuritalea sp.]|nr:hypothetical protein [Sulfuritalea sp.]
MRASRTNLVCLATICLTACATPKIALDHANNGVALTAGLQRELASYDQQQKTIDTLRRQVVIDETLQAKRYLRDNEFDDATASLTDDTAKFAIYTKMRQAAELRAKLLADKAADEKEVQSAMDSLMKPAAPPLPKIAATQKQLAELGDELPFADRLKLVTKFIKEVQAEVKSNKEAAEAAPPK